ncbi:hypothetical protein PSAC2689_10261 [Paraburkholderia sacchari]
MLNPSIGHGETIGEFWTVPAVFPNQQKSFTVVFIVDGGPSVNTVFVGR